MKNKPVMVVYLLIIITKIILSWIFWIIRTLNAPDSSFKLSDVIMLIFFLGVGMLQILEAHESHNKCMLSRSASNIMPMA